MKQSGNSGPDADGWSIVGDAEIVNGVSDYEGPGVVVFPGAVKMVAEELLSPIYYFTHGNAYSVTYPGSHGSLTDIEVAINQGEGTQLHAIGERRTPLKATTGFSQESPDEIARWFESLGTGARDLRCANGKSV